MSAGASVRERLTSYRTVSPASPTRSRARLAASVCLTLVGICFLVPLAWILLSSVDPSATVAVKAPSGLTTGNFTGVLTGELTGRPLLNSAVLSFGTALLTVAAGVLAAYPLSRYRMRFQRWFLYGVLFGTCLPVTAIMVPVYALFVRLKLLDSTLGTILFLSAAALPMAVWMLKNFMDAVPVSLEEAAWVDGAGAMRALARVVLPLMRPGIAVVFIFVFTQAWGNFFVPFVLLTSAERQPAAVAIYNFFGANGTVDYGQLGAFAILYSVPVLVLYVLTQRLTGASNALAGGIKG